MKQHIEELENDCAALREQLNVVAVELAEMEARGTSSGPSSALCGGLRSRVISRVSRTIRRAPPPLATRETEIYRGD